MLPTSKHLKKKKKSKKKGEGSRAWPKKILEVALLWRLARHIRVALPERSVGVKHQVEAPNPCKRGGRLVKAKSMVWCGILFWSRVVQMTSICCLCGMIWSVSSLKKGTILAGGWSVLSIDILRLKNNALPSCLPSRNYDTTCWQKEPAYPLY